MDIFIGNKQTSAANLSLLSTAPFTSGPSMDQRPEKFSYFSEVAPPQQHGEADGPHPDLSGKSEQSAMKVQHHFPPSLPCKRHPMGTSKWLKIQDQIRKLLLPSDQLTSFSSVFPFYSRESNVLAACCAPPSQLFKLGWADNWESTSNLHLLTGLNWYCPNCAVWGGSA